MSLNVLLDNLFIYCETLKFLFIASVFDIPFHWNHKSCTLHSLCAELLTNRLSIQEIVHQTTLFKINNKKSLENVYVTDRIIRCFTGRANWFWVWAAKCFWRPALKGKCSIFAHFNSMCILRYRMNSMLICCKVFPIETLTKLKGNDFSNGCTISIWFFFFSKPARLKILKANAHVVYWKQI